MSSSLVLLFSERDTSRQGRSNWSPRQEQEWACSTLIGVPWFERLVGFVFLQGTHEPHDVNGWTEEDVVSLSLQPVWMPPSKSSFLFFPLPCPLPPPPGRLGIQPEQRISQWPSWLCWSVCQEPHHWTETVPANWRRSSSDWSALCGPQERVLSEHTYAWLWVGAVSWACGLGLWGSGSVCVKSDQPVLTSVGTVCHCWSVLYYLLMVNIDQLLLHKHLHDTWFWVVHVLCQFESVSVKSDQSWVR